VKRISDDKELSETVGPGYHAKAWWKFEIEQAQKRLLWRLGWRGPCCRKDTDGDGDCLVHKSPGTVRSKQHLPMAPAYGQSYS